MKSILVLTGLLLSIAAAAQPQSASTATTPQPAGATVAGLRPYERPEGAPRQAEQPAAPEQMRRWLHGVSDPHPGNVDSIAATGHWWVPLRGPGMTPPYDPRGWHEAGSTAAQTHSTPTSTAAR